MQGQSSAIYAPLCGKKQNEVPRDTEKKTRPISFKKISFVINLSVRFFSLFVELLLSLWTVQFALGQICDKNIEINENGMNTLIMERHNLTRRCCIGFETLLKLVVREFDKGVVLLSQLKRQDSVVLFADLCLTLLKHPLANEAHLRNKYS